MITDQKYKIQEEKEEVKESKEEKNYWEEKVKREFPFDWHERLAMIQTAESILGAKRKSGLLIGKKYIELVRLQKMIFFLRFTTMKK